MSVEVRIALDPYARIEFLEVPAGVVVEIMDPTHNKSGEFPAVGADASTFHFRLGTDLSKSLKAQSSHALAAPRPAAVNPVSAAVPASTYVSGDHTCGGVLGLAVPVNADTLTYHLDLSSYPASKVATLTARVSYDGGLTWDDRGSKGQNGGPQPADGGTTTTDMFFAVDIGGDPSSALRRCLVLLNNEASLPTTGGSVTAG